MSKSRGNMQYPQPIARVLGADALRYFLLREMVFGQDGNFSRDALLTRYNSDLANGLGNLASRVLTMISKYFQGEIPAPPADSDGAVQLVFCSRIQAVISSYEKFAFAAALQDIWHLIGITDNYLTVEKPWQLATQPENRARLGEVLYNSAEALRIIAALAHPVMPGATQKIWGELGLHARLEKLRIDELAWGGLEGGTQIGDAGPLFPRVDHKEMSERIEKMEEEIRNPASAPAVPAAATPVAAAPAPAVNAKIGIDDFTKIEMRVGVVQSAEKVAGADKLLKVMVDIGTEVRQIVAGIAEAYKPEDIVGRKVAIVANLAPRKLRGVESNGMILAAAAGPDGTPVLATFAEDVPAGARLK